MVKNSHLKVTCSIWLA